MTKCPGAHHPSTDSERQVPKMNPSNEQLRIIGGSSIVDSDKGGAIKGTQLDFSRRLHRRGGDFHVYANQGYSPSFDDTMLLVLAMHNLEGVPVEYIKVKPFSLHIVHNSTVTSEKIVQVMASAFDKAEVELGFLSAKKMAVPVAFDALLDPEPEPELKGSLLPKARLKGSLFTRKG